MMAGTVEHLDGGVVADEIYAVVGAVDHVENTLRHTRLIGSINGFELCVWIQRHFARPRVPTARASWQQRARAQRAS
jgi:hypothetical protein